MKKFSKIGALVLAMMMILAMSVPAFAADGKGTGTNTYIGTAGTNATEDIAGTTTIPLNKTIVIFNTTDGTLVREPDVTFTYTVTPVTGLDAVTDPAAKKYVVDEHSKKAIIYDGVAGGVIGTTITFASTNTKVPATTNGYEDQKTANLTVDPSVFTHGGVYRYKIEETVAPTDVTTVGLEARTSDYVTTRYLDLYIYNNMVDDDNDPTTPAVQQGFKVGAAVMFKTTLTGGDAGKDPITTATEKTTGFEPGSNPSGSTNYTNDTKVDRYFTYNFQVKKVITGNLADKNHRFPFEITFTGTLSHPITADVDNNGTAGTISISTTDAPATAALKDGETYTVYGLPKGVLVDVKETNDTYDTYSLTTATQYGTAPDITSAVNLARDDSRTVMDIQVNCGNTTAVVATKDTVITFTNELVEVSPTGVVLRVAPFVGIMGAGLFLLLIAKRSKKDEDEDEDAVLETIPQNN